jgi:hypothetical protein
MQKFERFYAVVGADRVGKSTIIKELKNELLKNYSEKEIAIAHFSGPGPEDNSPIDQYTRVLDKITTPVVICDRFGSEVCFYEEFRRRFTIPEDFAHSIESYAVSWSKRFALLYVTAEWQTVRPRHEQEILAENSECTIFYKNLLLKGREMEHYKYQDYMGSYLTKRTSLDSRDIYSVTAENPLPVHQIRHPFYVNTFL